MSYPYLKLTREQLRKRAQANKQVSNNKKKASTAKYAIREFDMSTTTDYLTISKKGYNNPDHTNIDSHSGHTSNSFMSVLNTIATTKNISLPSDFYHHIESLILLGVNIQQCQQPLSIISALLLYIKGLKSVSIYDSCCSIMQDLHLLNADRDPIIEPHSSTSIDWTLLFEQSKTNWKLFTQNQGYKHIHTLLSVLVSAGLCSATNMNCSIGNIKLFSIKSSEMAVSAFDLVDAIFNTAIYFIEGGYRCFISKSIMPLLYNDNASYDLEAEFIVLKNQSIAFSTGSLLRDFQVTENDYSLLLDKHLFSLKEYVRGCTGFQKSTIHTRILAVEQLKSKFVATRISGSLKIAPYTIELFGGSGVGKSSVGAILMNILLRANNYDASPDRLMVWKEGDKYDTTMRNHTNGIFMDDVANTKTDYVERPATATIIQTCNNVPSYAVMADIDQKGKITNEAKVVIVSTNKKDLDSGTYSNCPLSILRRMHEIVTVKVKPAFVVSGTNLLDSDKVSRYYEDNIPAIPNLWNFTVEKAVAINAEHPSASVAFKVVETTEYGTLQDINIYKLIAYTQQQSIKHFKEQTSLVNNNKDLTDSISMCLFCRLPSLLCDCPSCMPEPQFGTILAKVAVSQFRYTSFLWDMWRIKAETRIETFTTKKLVNWLTWVEKSPYTVWTNYIPTTWFEDTRFSKCLLYCMSDDIERNMYTYYVLYLILASLFTCMTFSVLSYLGPILFCLAGLIIHSHVVDHVKRRAINTLAMRNDAMPVMFKKVRDEYVKYISGVFAGLGILYLAIKLYQAIRVECTDEHTLLAPTTIEEVSERNITPDVWLKAPLSTPICSIESKTTSPNLLQDRINRNLVFVKFHGEMASTISNGIYLQSNLLLLPNHMWVKDEYEVTITRDILGTLHSTMKTRLSKKHSYHIPNTDLSVVYAPGTGDWKNISKFLPLVPIEGSCPVLVSYRSIHGAIVKGFAMAKHANNIGTVAANPFVGSQYTLSFPTFKGLCMAPLISDTKQGVIVGFHLGGITDTCYGVSGSITQLQLSHAIDQLKCDPSILITKSAGVFPTSLYDVNYGLTSEIHHKSPLLYLDIASPMIDFIGTDNKRSKAFSTVVKSIISDDVAEICEKPNVYGPPPFHLGTKIWRKNLVDTVTPSLGVPAGDLRCAVLDYIVPLMKRANNPLWIDSVRPLTNMETVCGKDGQRFIDAMKANTSMGYPLTGPKSKYLTDLPPLDYPEFSCPRELHSKFWDEAYRMESVYLSGDRCYPVFKGCLKDEVTKETATKVRVFNSGPIAFQLLTRKYFLPIAWYLSMNPLESEIAVGINCYGPEWEEMHKHIVTFGSDRVLAGDYSAYDKRAPAQMMLAAFSIFIKLAKVFKYTPEMISIMEGIATDTVYSINSLNGDMVRFCNSNPSGNNLTVYLNCIMNSLWFRCGFYHTTGKQNSFRSVCKLMTYGDDAISSVCKTIKNFNHMTYASYLADNGMTFTMPNKTDAPTQFMHMSETDFLKRKSVFSSALNQHVGALDENSIFKSLHANMLSKSLTAKQLAAENIDGGLREWFYHGPDIYEFRRDQMKTVAARADITHMCGELDLTYEMRSSENSSTNFPPHTVSDSQTLEPDSSQRTRKRHFSRIDYYHENYNDYVPYYRYYVQPPFTTYHPCDLGCTFVNVFDTQSGIDRPFNDLGFLCLPDEKLPSSQLKEKIRFIVALNKLGIPIRIPASQAPRCLPEAQSGVDFPASFYYTDGTINKPKVDLYQLSRQRYIDSFNVNLIYTPVSSDFYGITERAFPGIQPPPPVQSDPPVKPASDGGPRSFRYDAQSGVITVDSVPDATKQSLTSFCDENTDWHEDIRHSKDDSYYIADNTDTSLQDFFSRPLRIATSAWTPTVPLNLDIDPWSLYFNNPRVANRIANFRSLRCNLKVKVLINGNPFYYGRAIMSYNPLVNFDNITDTTAPIQNIISASQRPHLYLDPCTSQGGTMTLPYCYFANALDIPLAQYNQMGRLAVRTINPLKHVNGAAENITISIFAWAEDVMLSTPTSFEPAGLVPQSGMVDEYSKDISDKKSLAQIKSQKVRNILIAIPKYARATLEAVKIAGEAAAILGLSRPILLDPVRPMRQLPTGLMATTDISDTVAKLTFDSKQEVTIDPRTVGLAPIDEMQLINIAKRESYFSTFNWTQTAAIDTPLWDCWVTPVVFDTVPVIGSTDAIHQTMASFATLPFRYWRGTIRYRFQVICSSFHKGRLKIAWDPLAQLGPLEFNNQYTHIVDIGAETDFSIEVGWGATTPYLLCDKPGRDPKPFRLAPATAATPRPATTNGTLTVYVLNELTTPSPTVSDISINVSMAMCDDYQVFDPDTEFSKYSYFPQSGSMMNMEDPERGAPTTTEVCRIFGSRIDANDQSHVICHGDPVSSIRTLMKRYNFHSSTNLSIAVTNAPAWGQMNFSAFPYYRGNAPGAIHAKIGGFTNYALMTYVNYFTPAYACRRGGLRTKFMPCTNVTPMTAATHVVRSQSNTYTFGLTTMVFGNQSAAVRAKVLNEPAYHAGGTSNPISNGFSIDAEIPYSSNNRFTPGRFMDYTVATPFIQAALLSTPVPPLAVGSFYTMDRYISTGEDFALFWLLSAPKIWYLPVGFPPA